MKIHCCFLLLFYCCSVYSAESEDDIRMWTNDQDGIFGPLLEEWTLSYDKVGHREKRVMMIPRTEGGFVASKILTFTANDTRPPKIINRPANTVTRPPIPLYAAADRNDQPSREVSETDLYLLGALEKMAYKIDNMEKRIRHLEEMLYSVVAGNKIDTEPCPNNFTRVLEGCYYFGERKFDWQVANKYCRRMGALLVEFESTEERNAVISAIQTTVHLKDKDFWTSGLNPGLLWIWSNSARPVLSKSDSTEIRGNGRCLSIMFDPAHRRYNYRGNDCSLPQMFVCEHEDKSSSNSISRIGKEKKILKT